ncbi:MAG: hypothetical protein WBD67_03660 [Terracidiphilus sp.]
MRLALVPALMATPGARGSSGAGQPWVARAGIAESRQLHIGGATVQVDFARGDLDLSRDAVMRHIRAAASAVTNYYGRFPVERARILVVPEAGHRGGFGGTTWGAMGGYQGFTRLRIGAHATEAEMRADWVATHEMVHMAFPTMPEDQHWIEEGQATYIEPIARVRTGELTAQEVWGEMVRGMPQGEPRAGDEGLDRTHTWARTYWGGALFCLVADVEIRKATDNKKGLEDALRAVVDAGGTIDQEWPLEKALKIGDKATGTHVLMRLYRAWSRKPVEVDLPKLWAELGVRMDKDGKVAFDAKAPQAAMREKIAGRVTAPARLRFVAAK